MTIVDFRSGGFQDTQPHRLARDFPYGQATGAPYGDQLPDEGWDDPRYADAPYGIRSEPAGLASRLSRLTHYIGALISVGLIVVLAVWAFKLAVRDVSGLPIIRSMEGEARISPTNPGGELTERTGLAVNSIAAGSTARLPDQVAIAPPATGLAEQDVPMGELGVTSRVPTSRDEMPLDETTRVIPLPDGEAATLAEAASQSDVVENALISDAPVGEAPVNEALTDLSGREPQDLAISQALTEAHVMPPATVAQSSRPVPRPRRVATATAPTPATAVTRAPAAAETAGRPAATPAEAAEPAPAKVAAGSAMVQIGAFDSDALAKGEWKRVSGKFGGLFTGKSRVVQEAQSGGRTFWRLRAGGFSSKDEARKFCAALIAGGVDCIPATAK